MNEQDKNQMWQAIINEGGESDQAKIWGTLMADTKTIIALTAAAGSAAGALINEYCYITVDVYMDKQAIIEGAVEEMEEFIDEVHPYTEEDIRLLNEKYGKDLRKISA